jgi:hypothetical protein
MQENWFLADAVTSLDHPILTNGLDRLRIMYENCLSWAIYFEINGWDALLQCNSTTENLGPYICTRSLTLTLGNNLSVATMLVFVNPSQFKNKK